MIKRDNYREFTVGGNTFLKYSEKLFMENRRIYRDTMKREIDDYCKRAKVSKGSLRRSCDGKPSLEKMYELVQG